MTTTDTQPAADPGLQGDTRLSPADITRHFGDGYRGIEILGDGTIREIGADGATPDETVTRTLKTERTWY